MMRTTLLGLVAFGLLCSLQAAVVNLAPEFVFPAAGNKTSSLKSLRGQPVVLVLARSPRVGDFRAQIKEIEHEYGQFATRSAVFVAAFAEGEGPVRADVPFVVAENGAGVLASYGVQDKFCIVIIGKDGNIDYQTNRVLRGQHIRDVMQNAFPVQQQERK